MLHFILQSHVSRKIVKSTFSHVLFQISRWTTHQGLALELALKPTRMALFAKIFKNCDCRMECNALYDPPLALLHYNDRPTDVIYRLTRPLHWGTQHTIGADTSGRNGCVWGWGDRTISCRLWIEDWWRNGTARRWRKLWCCSHSHHYFCTTEIGRPNLDQFLIRLTKHILFEVGNFQSDGFQFTQKLREL